MSRNNNKYQTRNTFETFKSWVNKLQDEAKRTAIEAALVKCVRLENSNAEQQSNALETLNGHLSDSHKITGKIKIKWGSITSYQALLKGQQSLASPNVITEETSAQATATVASANASLVSQSQSQSQSQPQFIAQSISPTPTATDTTAASVASKITLDSDRDSGRGITPSPVGSPTASQPNPPSSSSTPPESKPLPTFAQWMKNLQDQQRKQAIETAIKRITVGASFLTDLAALNQKLSDAYKINPNELSNQCDADTFVKYQAQQKLASGVPGSSAGVGQTARPIVASSVSQQQPGESREAYEARMVPLPPLIPTSSQRPNWQPTDKQVQSGTETSAAQSPQFITQPQEKMQQLTQLANAYHPVLAQQAENDADRKARKKYNKTTECLGAIRQNYQDRSATAQIPINLEYIVANRPEQNGLYTQDLPRHSNTTTLANNEGWFLEKKFGDQITTSPVLFSSEQPDLRITLSPQEARTHFQLQLQDFFSIDAAKSNELLNRLERIYTQNLPAFVAPYNIANFQKIGHDSMALLDGTLTRAMIEYDSTADILKLHITTKANVQTMKGMAQGGPYDLGAVHYTIELSKKDGFQFTHYHADNPLLDRFISRLPHITPQEEYDFLRQVLIKQQKTDAKWKPNIADITVLFQYAEEKTLKHNFEGLDLTNISAGQRIKLLRRPYLPQADQNTGINPEKYIGFFKDVTLTAQQFEQLKDMPEILQGANLYGQALSVTNVNTIKEYNLNHLFNGAIISDVNVIKKCVELGLKCEGATVTSGVLQALKNNVNDVGNGNTQEIKKTKEASLTILKNINLRGQTLTEDDVKFIAKHKLNHLFNGAIISDFNVIETCFNLGLKCEDATVTSSVLKKLQEEITTRTASIDNPAENSGMVRLYEHQREKYFTILKNINLRGQTLTEDDVKFIAKHKLDNLMKGAVLADGKAAHAWIRSGLSYSAQPVLSDALKAAQQAQFDTFSVLYGKDNTPQFANIIQVEKYLFEGKDALGSFKEAKTAYETTKLIIKTYTEANEKNPHPDILTQFRYLQGMVQKASAIAKNTTPWLDPNLRKKEKEAEDKAVDAKKDALIVLPTLDLKGQTLNAADIKFIAEHKLDHLMRGTIIAGQEAVDAWITSGLSDTFKPKISAAFLAATQPLVTEEEKARFLATQNPGDTTKRFVPEVSTEVTTTSLDAKFAKFKQCWKLHYPQKKSPEFENIIEVGKYLYEHSRLIDAPSFEVKAVKNAYAATQLAMYHQFETAMFGTEKVLQKLITENKNNPGELTKLAAPFIEHAKKLGVLSEIPYLVEAKKISSKEEEKKADLKRQTELKEQAEAEKQAAAARQAERAKQAEQQKREEIQARQAELGKQAVSIGLLTIPAGSGAFAPIDVDITLKHKFVDARYEKGNAESQTEQTNNGAATTIFINPTADKKQMAKSFEPLYQAMAQGNALMFMHQRNTTSPVSQTPHQFQFLEKLDARRIGQIPALSQIPEAFAYQIEALNKFRAWVNDNQVQINNAFTGQAGTTSNTPLLTALIDLAKRDQSLVFSSISPKPLDGVDDSLIRAYFEEYVKTKRPEAVAAQNPTVAQSGQGGGAPATTTEVRELGANLRSGTGTAQGSSGAGAVLPREERGDKKTPPTTTTATAAPMSTATTAQSQKPEPEKIRTGILTVPLPSQQFTYSNSKLTDDVIACCNTLASPLPDKHVLVFIDTNIGTHDPVKTKDGVITAIFTNPTDQHASRTPEDNKSKMAELFKPLYEAIAQGQALVFVKQHGMQTKETNAEFQPQQDNTRMLPSARTLYGGSQPPAAFDSQIEALNKFCVWVEKHKKTIDCIVNMSWDTNQNNQQIVDTFTRMAGSYQSTLPFSNKELNGVDGKLIKTYFEAYVEAKRPTVNVTATNTASSTPTP